MTGLELALDLSRSTFNLNLGTRQYTNGSKFSSSISLRLLNNFDDGLQYVPGELGGYQTVLKKDNHPISSLAMLAFSSSEFERCHSRSSDTSGFNSMASISPTETSSMKLRYENAKLEPIIHDSRNILDMGDNIREDGKPFFVPATSEKYTEISIKEKQKRLNVMMVCPDCAFETL